MTDKLYICEVCQSEMDAYEKDDYVVIVHPCAYCDEEVAKIARLCSGKVDNLIEANKESIRISAVGSDKGQINLEERVARHNEWLINMAYRAMEGGK